MTKPREQYWNGQYVEYWEEKVREANHVSNSAKSRDTDVSAPSDAIYSELVKLLALEVDSRVLEMGCGFGRTITFLYQMSHNIAAIDISPRMVELAASRHKDLRGVNFLQSEAENTPFESDRFHSVICFGVFDALFQAKALVEINRILRVGGVALLTGKNDYYFADDVKALEAERNARAKGQPNYFTDVRRLLLDQLWYGFHIVHQRFFLRRGDMASNRFTSVLPERFYEYALLLKKRQTSQSGVETQEIGAAVSKTFIETFGVALDAEENRAFGRES